MFCPTMWKGCYGTSFDVASKGRFFTRATLERGFDGLPPPLRLDCGDRDLPRRSLRRS
eukprot:m.31565 g.31565  ORF g.31565 m.31565 type:complete len:58 (-) comp6318_c0_seq1:392-565(-)